MGRFKVEISRREEDWSPAAGPLLPHAAGPGDAPLQTGDIDTPEFTEAPLQTSEDTPEFAEAPLQTDTVEFAEAPLQTTPDTPEFAPRDS